MARKIAIPVILLSLVVVQASVVNCGLKCGAMNHTASPCTMQGMQDCPDMQDEACPSSSWTSVQQAPADCSWKLCMLDVSLLQSQAEHETLLAKGSFIGAIFKNVLADEVFAGHRLSQFTVTRSTQSIPPFDPLISTLRI